MPDHAPVSNSTELEEVRGHLIAVIDWCDRYDCKDMAAALREFLDALKPG
jgi:hypothetical protein